MKKQGSKRIGSIIMKSLLTLMLLGLVALPLMGNGFKGPENPLENEDIISLDSYTTKVFTFEEPPADLAFNPDDLVANIKNFVDTPKGGIAWDVFSKTKEIPYSYKDEEDLEWNGVRPEFTEELKKLEGTEILIQGYMFPLGQEEKQDLFLLGPFPLSCPYHYHVPPNLIIEAHPKKPEDFSYDAINIKGKLELVSKDDEYNVFYRLNDVEVVK